MLTEKISEALKKRMGAMREKTHCEACGCQIPVYPGRYPIRCPECDAEFIQSDSNNEEETPWKQFTNTRPEWAIGNMNENSTEDALKSLEAIIGSLEKGDAKGDAADMLKMGKGILDYYKKNGSFAPKQAQWIYNTSKSMFK